MRFKGGHAGALSAATVVGIACMPQIARAEGISGADILLPKPAEFIPALIAFLIIWIVLAKLVWPSVLGMMQKRQQQIQDDLDAAEQSKTAAEKARQEYEAGIADAKREADEIIAQAKFDAEAERTRVMDKARTDAAAIVAKAHDTVDAERKKAMIELSTSVVDLSVEIASKIIGGALSEDDQRRLAEKYLEEVSTNHE
ncbi:MAG: F0F1 ATP synthase subunit B [Atopobium sp.]|uniref:F0F1 ATP synthase subunit B n=1 Tax=Atopobium sp. TaxID=1872650 RepID=UPI002A7FA2D1|nr:F0F1 ATP synthase subunit B [Atopobium sp.]MDY4522822.1 F0F1 ATP synthase subunit B [Atopobium sp.]